MFLSNDALFEIPERRKQRRLPMINAINKFLKNENGATAIEYGLIASLIAVAIIVGVTAVGTNLQALFTTVSTNV
jgi:pilus assembly protein Flp/PilA